MLRCPLLAGSTLSASRSKAAVAKNGVAANDSLLVYPRIHTPGQKRSFERIAANIGNALSSVSPYEHYPAKCA
jgi:hypothetical protein